MEKLHPKLRIPTITIVIIVFFTQVTFSQQRPNSDNLLSTVTNTGNNFEVKDGDYLIRVFALKTAKGYGYEILSNNTVIVHQTTIPYLEVVKSFSKIENAYKIAKYHVAQLIIQPIEKLNMSVTKAAELGISEEDLSISNQY